MNMPYVKLYEECFKLVRRASDEDIGQAFRALYIYVTTGEEIELSPMAGVMFDTMKDKYDRDLQEYATKCNNLRKSAEKRWKECKSNANESSPAVTESDADANECPSDCREDAIAQSSDANTMQSDGTKPNLTNKDIQTKRKRFVIPTLEEVKSYCLQRNNNVDAQRFIDFYASKGWRVGNQPMRDWKAAVRTWQRSNSSNGNSGTQTVVHRKVTNEQAYDQRQYTASSGMPEWMRQMLTEEQKARMGQ